MNDKLDVYTEVWFYVSKYIDWYKKKKRNNITQYIIIKKK